MNMDHISPWDIAHTHSAAERERAKALRELRSQFTHWLRTRLAGGRTHAAPRECLDCGV